MRYIQSIVTNGTKNKNKINNSNNILLVLLSGIFLGLAIFTKIPILITIPLIGYLILTNSVRSWKILALWFVPVILIPLIWPAYSVAVGQFDPWLEGVLNQTQRTDKPPFDTIFILFKLDPILLIFGLTGLFFAVLKRDLFILLWAIPNILFHYFIGYYPYREFIPLLPLFCIAGAVLIVNVAQRFKLKKHTNGQMGHNFNNRNFWTDKHNNGNNNECYFISV